MRQSVNLLIKQGPEDDEIKLMILTLDQVMWQAVQ